MLFLILKLQSAATLMGQVSIPHFEPGILKVDKQ